MPVGVPMAAKTTPVIVPPPAQLSAIVLPSSAQAHISWPVALLPPVQGPSPSDIAAASSVPLAVISSIASMVMLETTAALAIAQIYFECV